MCVMMCFPMGLSCTGTLFASWTLVTVSFPMLGKFLTIFSSNIFSSPPVFSFFCATYNSNVCVLNVIPVYLRLSLFVSIIFLHSSPQWWFPPLHLPVHSSILLPHLFCYWFLLSVIFILVIMVFIYVLLFFSFSRFLIDISSIFSIYFSIVKTIMRQERQLHKN